MLISPFNYHFQEIDFQALNSKLTQTHAAILKTYSFISAFCSSHKNKFTNAFIIIHTALPKPYVSVQDFYREFHLGLCLGSHKNIVSTYDVAFETSGFYVFTQEYAPLGNIYVATTIHG